MAYVIRVVPNYPLLPPSTWHPHGLRQSPHHCSCPWVMYVSASAAPFPMLCFTSPWLFCNYLFILLNPLTSLRIPPQPSPIRQPSEHSLYPSFCIYFLSFLDSIVNRYVFITILLFIVLIFFLNKSL